MVHFAARSLWDDTDSKDPSRLLWNNVKHTAIVKDNVSLSISENGHINALYPLLG